ncbi:MAG: orotate phosphoribosyltransferase [Chitinophagaceae bacterium]
MTDAAMTAEKLIQAKAVQLSLQYPYTWASGWKSPIYCDNRRVLSHPMIRDYIKSELCNVVFEKFGDAEVVAAVATAGIAWGAMIADQLKLPLIYVRSKPKEHGLGNQIEGEFVAQQRAVVIEDLISTGKSSLQVVEVLRTNSVEVIGMVSIFNYGFDAATNAFTASGVPVHSLTDYETILELAKEKGTTTPQEQEVLLKWRQDPANWNGIY